MCNRTQEKEARTCDLLVFRKESAKRMWKGTDVKAFNADDGVMFWLTN